jgi:hypothetical protein
MPRKQHKIQVTSTVRDNQIANIVLDWYELQLKTGQMLPTCLETHGVDPECTCERPVQVEQRPA